MMNDGCLKEVAADLDLEGWIEYGEKERCPRCMGMYMCLEKNNPCSHHLPSESFTGEGA